MTAEKVSRTVLRLSHRRLRELLKDAVPYTIRRANGQVFWDGESWIVRLPPGLDQEDGA